MLLLLSPGSIAVSHSTKLLSLSNVFQDSSRFCSRTQAAVDDAVCRLSAERAFCAPA